MMCNSRTDALNPAQTPAQSAHFTRHYLNLMVFDYCRRFPHEIKHFSDFRLFLRSIPQCTGRAWSASPRDNGHLWVLGNTWPLDWPSIPDRHDIKTMKHVEKTTLLIWRQIHWWVIWSVMMWLEQQRLTKPSGPYSRKITVQRAKEQRAAPSDEILRKFLEKWAFSFEIK